MGKCLFVTGTGTDIGKTYVAALIVKKFRDLNISAGYYKAAASGEEIEKIPADVFHVKKIAGLTDDMNKCFSYSYKNSVSPHLAAKIEKRPIDFAVVERDFLNAKSRYDFLTVEGSGGIICPLRRDDKEILMLDDLIIRLNLPAVIVIDSKLGEINSAVLTAEHLRAKQIPINGLIFNRYDENNLMHRDNKSVIEEITGLKTLAVVHKNSDSLDIEPEILTNLYS